MKTIFALIIVLVSIAVNAQISTDTLKVGYTSASPFIIKNDQDLSGINIRLWDMISEDLNLHYELVEMPFGDMLNALETGSIDVSINPLTITSERTNKFDFTNPYYVANATIAVHKPSVIRQLLDVVKNFFNLDFLRGLFVLVFIIAVFGVLGWYFEKGKNGHFRDNSKGIWDGLWWSVVTITTVGYGDKSPKTKSGKIIALMLMFTGLLFISGLTASIASSLTVNQMGNNKSDYSAFKDQKVGTVAGTSMETYLKHNFFKDVNGYNGVVEGLTALNNKELDAFIYDEPILKYRLRQNKELDNIDILPIKFDVQFYAFGLSKKQHDLEHIISLKVLKIIETKEWEILLSEFGLTEI